MKDRVRYEVKFVTDVIWLDQLKHWLCLHKEGFSQAYPARQVNNVYFDTPDLFAYAQNLSGISARRKIRYRWYGDSLTPLPGNLEIKSKRNNLGWKTRFPVKETVYTKGDVWQTFQRRLRGQLSIKEHPLIDDSPFVVLINSYHRDYYVSWDGKVSVTLDSQQVVMGQRLKADPNFEHKSNMRETIILEVKCANENKDSATRLTRDIPLRLSRHSKYVTGVRSILA